MADREDIEQLIHSTGFYRNKAKHIQGACHKIVKEFNGRVPKTMAELLTLPGVARKTANVVLAHAFGINAGVTVDTHVKRLSNRLKLTEHSDPVRIEKDLMKLIPRTGLGELVHSPHRPRAIGVRRPQTPLRRLLPAGSLSHRPVIFGHQNSPQVLQNPQESWAKEGRLRGLWVAWLHLRSLEGVWW